MESGLVRLTDDQAIEAHPVVVEVEAWVAQHIAQLPAEAAGEVEVLRHTARRLVTTPFANYAAIHKALLTSMQSVRAFLVVEDVEDPFDALSRRLSTSVRD